jgi:shikimate kinase
LTRRHVILVGLPGSGKTTVGRLAAAALAAPFVDLDEAIAGRAGKSVARLFAEDGEAVFRALEVELGEAALRGPPSVVAPGGGFFAADVTRSLARGSGLVVYLQTEPAEAAARLGGAAGRPLLAGGPTASRVAALLAERAPWYRQAECRIMTDGRSAADVVAAVVSLARDRAGW